MATTQSNKKSLIGTVGPAIPLGLALLHGAITGGGAGSNATVPPPSPVVATASARTARSSGNSLASLHCGGGTADSPACSAPVPMLAKGHPVDWFFVFKLNAAKFPGCEGDATRTCPFGGEVEAKYATKFSQRYAMASAEDAGLQEGGTGCLGTGTNDPVGATFDEIYNGKYHFIVWNDQFKGSPVAGCGSDDCGAPWGHSKGMLAWNDAGEGMVMQVSTPSWPAAGNVSHGRQGDGNTLGCVNDDNVGFSQHFFGLHLTKSDLLMVVAALSNANIVTDASNPELANVGGPGDVVEAVNGLGHLKSSQEVKGGLLSSGIRLIAKPSALHVPPWQMVSAELGGISLRTATWWMAPEIPPTSATTAIDCWSPTLSKPGAVEISTGGTWDDIPFSLKGGGGTNGNHAKIGVSTSGTAHYAIFGDMNQQGALSGNCGSSQNGRGGLFFVVDNQRLADGITGLISAETEPLP